ncbi:MAG: Bcr/CflA family multidrug efflux MFS transporter [Enterobacteriaceae bacterium]|nr:Bcr/CflA family multidrug efflux MFS transporter [Enterobacteriaceae bacterium]
MSNLASQHSTESAIKPVSPLPAGVSRGWLIFILGLLSMLMPLSIDMYLPALPNIALGFGVSDGMVQLTLSVYIIGFAIGQLVYGPVSDSIGRKSVIIVGVLVFAVAAAGCALSQTVGQLILLRCLHGLAAASASVVINALMRDLFSKDEFSRMMSFVTLVMTIGPLLAPIIGGLLLVWFSWHAIFWSLSGMALLAVIIVAFCIPETLHKHNRQKFSLMTTLRNFVSLFRHRRVISYMLSSAFSFAGMFSFLSAGPFVYIDLNGVSPQNFGYYFALNIIFLFIMTTINSRNVRRLGAVRMLRLGLTVQFVMGMWLVFSQASGLGFWALVLGVAGYMGSISMISSNAMAVILEDFPHMAGTAASLAGTLRFGVGAAVGGLLALTTSHTAWPMISSMAFCVISAVFFYGCSLRKKIH